MEFTNLQSYPKYLFDWLVQDDYDHHPGTLSATTLLKPARAVALARLHSEELVMDAADLVAVRYGTALHQSFERIAIDGIQERRFAAEFEGQTITGKPDLVIDGKIIDIKSTSTWKWIFGEFDDYILQLSVYRWLLAENGEHPGQEAEICFLFTDWSKSRAKREKDYPQSRVAVRSVELLSLDDTEIWMRERIGAFSAAEQSISSVKCTDKDLWKDPDKYALMKEGNKRAVKVYSDPDQAREAMSDPKHYVEVRPSKAKRCGYCIARPFCGQYKQMLEKDEVDE